jgi:hypothetical protein
MKTLRNTLAVALLVVPALMLNAGVSPARSAAPELRSTHSLAGTCYIIINGNMYSYPC